MATIQHFDGRSPGHPYGDDTIDGAVRVRLVPSPIGRQPTVASGVADPRATVLSMPAHTFKAVYEDAGGGWVYAHVPELPEVHTQGETLDQAREMVKDAIELVLEARQKRGEAIPPTGWALVESVEVAA